MNTVTWYPINTAPKDGTYVIVWPPTFTGVISCACWNDDRFAKRPRPYWFRTDANGSASLSRYNPPTHWTSISTPEGTVMQQTED